MNEKERKDIIEQSSKLKGEGANNAEVATKIIGVAGGGKAGLLNDVMKAIPTQGIIIAVYPEMGQGLLSDMHNNYTYLNSVAYERSMENGLYTDLDERQYVEDAIALVTKKRKSFDICFIDALEPVLDQLASVNEPYIIFYPNTSKESVLKMMAQMYLADPNNNSAKKLANAILHYDEHIAHLRLYPNSIAASTGIINENFVKDLAKMRQLDRIQVIQAFSTIKESKKK